MNETLLSLLISVRQNGRRLQTVPPEAKPASLAEAYATADALAAWMGDEVVGWKIGASVARGQQALGLAEPFAGRLFRRRRLASGGQIRPRLDHLTIGAEFTCRLGRDLAPEERFDADSIAAVVADVYPSLELNQVSYADPMGAGGLCIIADNGFNDGLVIGDEIEDWQVAGSRWQAASEKLKQQPVAFYLDGALWGTGCAADIDFNPLAALAWLANDRAARGHPLRAGQLVATGDLVGAIEAERGSEVMADFGPYGQVWVQLV